MRMGKPSEMTIPYVSLFTGAMGLDVGLERIGFRAVVCNEIDRQCIETIRANRPSLPIVDDDICRADWQTLNAAAGQDLRGIPLLVGGPPCQAFSVYGNRQGVADERGLLVYEFIRLVSELRPKVFLMENVRGLHSMSIVPSSARDSTPAQKTAKGSLLREIFSRFERIGYRVDGFLVNVVNYGGPQLRERLLCIGNRLNLHAEFPPPQFSNRPQDNLPPFRTLGDAIGGSFTDPDPEVMNFSPRKLRYLAMVPPGGNWRSLPKEIQKESMGKVWYLKGGRSAYWRKLSFDHPSPTVVTMPNHAGTSMCHPTELRALTVGEMAAIQEFPTEWVFSGSVTQKCRQVGNAVPPRLGEVSGRVVLDLLRRIDALPGPAKVEPLLPSTVRHVRPHVRTRSYWKNGLALAGNHGYYRDAKDPRQRSLF